MITFFIDSATVLAAILFVTRDAQNSLKIPLRDAHLTNIVEAINSILLSNFLFDVVRHKWLTLIMSTNAPEHVLHKFSYSAAFSLAYHISTIGNALCVDRTVTVIVQLFAMCTYWTVFNKREQNVRMYEEERDKWHEQLRELQATIARRQQDIRQNPTPEREQSIRAALAALRTAKKHVKDHERALFRGGYLRKIKGVP
ncbi:hypothetical protein PVAR5_3972 [Paecilomyces variotii No. 5]|uniref:Uncharacterized protein n=1 Tax=Byssochlamys spectabilis (strain No. 5 / NBRC 109023) TaxID=1356009 RepID=V5HZ70_BYSSN|nr:hypothetical protein PVAR5_3972 [Paecilomyces variotii No. 5]